MGLLDGRHKVMVTPTEVVEDEWGEVSTHSLPPVVVACTVQWGSPQEAADLTVSPATSVTVVARKWPGTSNCHFVWNGQVFEQVGPAREFSGSRRTAHFEVFGRLIAESGQ